MEQDGIKPPEHLIEFMCEEMKKYQLNPESFTGIEPIGPDIAVLPQTPRLSTILITSLCTVAAVGLVYLSVPHFNNEMQQAYEEGLYTTEIVEYPEEDEGYDPDNQEAVDYEDEPTDDDSTTDQLPVEDEDNTGSEQAPPNESGGRFELIIRQTQEE